MSIARIVRDLQALRRSTGRGAAAEKRRLLRTAGRALSQHRWKHATVRAWHDALMFLAAYPDDAALSRAVVGELRRIERLVRRAYRENASRAGNGFDDSGIAGSRVYSTYTLRMARWLSRTYGRAVDIDWRAQGVEDRLDDLLGHLALVVERDGLLDDRIGTRDWLRLAAGGRRPLILAWLIDRLDQLWADEALREQLFASLKLFLVWRLDRPTASRTFGRFPPRRIFHQRDALVRSVSLCDWLDRPIGTLRPLAVTKAREVLDACRTALCVRHREIDTLTYANEREVYLARLDRGVDVAVFGMTPSRRLPIESYFGFVAARNRVPVAYGGGWVFFDRCEIGVNVFEAFRGGESALLFAEVIRVYRRLFRSRVFQVDPFQFGAQNREAIVSGAYWFYDRLGFRPVSAEAARLAERERRRIAEDRSYRSPERVLRRLTGAKLVYVVEGAGDARRTKTARRGRRPAAPDLSRIGLAVTRWIGKRFDGDREAAQRWSLRRAMRALGTGSIARWPEDERASFKRMCILLGPIRALGRWERADKQRVVDAFRAKGGVREYDFVLALQRCERLRDGWNRLRR